MKEIKYYFMIPLLLLLLLLADVAVVLGFFYCYVFRYTDDSSIDEMDPAYQNATVLDEHFHDTNGCKFIFLETQFSSQQKSSTSPNHKKILKFRKI
ncbi:MAG: hypothetical protein ACLU8C_10405 [Lacrimispora saccharolytica]